MIALLNTIIILYLLTPDNIKIGCLDLFYLLVLAALIAIFGHYNQEQEA